MTTDVHGLAHRLDEAVRTATAITQLSAAHRLTLDEAYRVQHAGIDLRSRGGDPVVGVKLGFTSKAKATQMGVADVIIGSLTAGMCIEDGGTVDLDRLVHPRIEPEVAFRLGRAIDPHDPADDPLSAVTDIAPALEIIDSRYRDFRFSLEDVVADNTSAAGFVVGAWRQLDAVRSVLDVSNTAVVLQIDGEATETGSTSAILGDPLRALDAVKRLARLHGFSLPAGSIILAGAATAAVPVTPGVLVEADVAGLGRVAVSADGRTRHG